VWCVVHCLSDFEFMAAHSVVVIVLAPKSAPRLSAQA
jgi:hypothetical protein